MAGTLVKDAGAPPHSIEAEQLLLGAIIINNDVLRDCIGIIKDRDQFYRHSHALIFDIMMRLDEQGFEIDPVSVANELKSDGMLDKAGGLDYLWELAEKVPDSGGWRHHAVVVRDKAILRAILNTTHSIKAKAQDPTSKPDQLIEELEGEVFKLGAARFHKDSKRVQDILEEFRKMVDQFKAMRLNNDAVPGLRSGYGDLDALTTGFKPGELIILAARPGHGKTSLALNIAAHVALYEGERRGDGKGGVAFFSLEMRDVELVSRIVCSEARVNLKHVRNGTITPTEEREMNEMLVNLAASPLFVDDTFDLTMQEIRAKSRRLKDKYDIDFVVVDYLQLINGDTRLDRHEQIGVISRGLKGLARELDIPVLALAQLNRSIEGRTGVKQRPMLSDLRESGSIEQDADIVSFIQRDLMLDAVKAEERKKEYQHLEGQERLEREDTEPATLIIAKNRSGPLGDVPLMFRKSCTKFENRDKFHADEFRGGY